MTVEALKGAVKEERLEVLDSRRFVNYKNTTQTIPFGAQIKGKTLIQKLNTQNSSIQLAPGTEFKTTSLQYQTGTKMYTVGEEVTSKVDSDFSVTFEESLDVEEVKPFSISRKSVF